MRAAAADRTTDEGGRCTAWLAALAGTGGGGLVSTDFFVILDRERVGRRGGHERFVAEGVVTYGR